MTTEPKLETYLSELDKYLGQIPVSDRADIIIEIKSHVLQAQEKSPNEDIGLILHSMGEPESVAKRYLQERGLQFSLPKQQSSSMMWLPASIKWLVIGFLSFVGIIVIVASLLIWRFTPLISIDDTTNQVTIGNGLIQIHDSGKKTKSVINAVIPEPADKSSVQH
jgi:uncharacterized membrane protein